MTTMMLQSIIMIFQTNDEQLLCEWLTLIIAVKYECKKHVFTVHLLFKWTVFTFFVYSMSVFLVLHQYLIYWIE